MWPPRTAPLKVGPRISMWVTTPPSSRWANQALPYGPSHTEDYEAWKTQTLQWIGCSAILLVLGIALTALLARRLRRQRAALR